MKVIFFGLGSIGQRHARLLKKHFKHELFAYRSSSKSPANPLGVPEVHSWAQVKAIQPDVAFITNPTDKHIKTALACAKLGMHLFVEKPIDATTKDLSKLVKLVKQKQLASYVAYCLRFHPLIVQLQRLLQNDKKLHARVVASSYLPAWRLQGDYTKGYSAWRKCGGGVILDLSHELDYTSFLLGEIGSISGQFGKLSHLAVRCEDYADLLLRCKRGSATLHLDFYSKTPQRSIVVTRANGQVLRGDLLRNTLTISSGKRDKTYSWKVNRDDFLRFQLAYFFKNIKNQRMMNNLSEASSLFKTIVSFKERHEK